jgi:hypothetical protein
LLSSVDQLEKLKKEEEALKYFDTDFVVDEDIVNRVVRYGYPKSYVK